MQRTRIARLLTACAAAALCTASAQAATISHSIDTGPETLDISTQGTQDWLLINNDDSGTGSINKQMIIEHQKSGGSGITLGTGFGTELDPDDNFGEDVELRGPKYTWSDGIDKNSNPSTGAGIDFYVSKGNNNAYGSTPKTYSLTFAAVNPGQEHTVNIYAITGRTTWSDISATWNHADPVSLSASSEAINAEYTLTYTPDSLGDDVTVTFTASTNQPSNDWRLGFTGASLAVVPEPSSLALLGLGGLLIASRRRRG